MKITKEEYLEALKIVENYHNQIIKEDVKVKKIIDDKSKTTLKNWNKLNLASERLKNTLKALMEEQKVIDYENHYWDSNGNWVIDGPKYKIDPPIFYYIEDVKKRDFLRIRNAGKKTWEEFEKLATEGRSS